MSKTKDDLRAEIIDLKDDYKSLSRSYDALHVLWREQHERLENIAALALPLLREIAQ